MAAFCFIAELEASGGSHSPVPSVELSDIRSINQVHEEQ